MANSNVNNEILPVKIRTNINCRRFHNNVTKSLMTLVVTIYASSEDSGDPAPRQNFSCSHKQAMSQEEPSDRKPDPWPL